MALSLSSEQDRLTDQLHELEQRAGIAKDADQARQGPLFPLGAFGKNVSPEEYFDDQHDYVRRGIRNLYFGVEDLSLRTQLIGAERNLDEAHRGISGEEVRAAERRLAEAEAKADRLPWDLAAVLGAGSVAVGHYMEGIAGAIAGAVFGFFIGMGAIAKARADAREGIAEAKEGLKQALEAKRDSELRPDFFSISEEVTGERNNEFDHESAAWNRAR
jgi:hypothetical protein